MWKYTPVKTDATAHGAGKFEELTARLAAAGGGGEQAWMAAHGAVTSIKDAIDATLDGIFGPAKLGEGFEGTAARLAHRGWGDESAWKDARDTAAFVQDITMAANNALAKEKPDES